MKLDTNIMIGVTGAGDKRTWKGKLTNLEYSMASGEGDVIFPITVEMPSTISIAGKFDPKSNCANIAHEFVVNRETPAHLQCKVIIQGKLEFEEELPADIHNMVVELTRVVSLKPSSEMLFTISDDEIEGVIEGNGIRTLQGRKKRGSGDDFGDGPKMPGSGVGFK